MLGESLQAASLAVVFGSLGEHRGLGEGWLFYSSLWFILSVAVHIHRHKIFHRHIITVFVINPVVRNPSFKLMPVVLLAL